MSQSPRQIKAEARRQQTLSAYRNFFNTSLDSHLQQCLEQDAEAAVLGLFQDVAATVPAYQQFLAELAIPSEGFAIAPATIQTFEQFQTLPLVTKENYLLRHPIADLCRHGQLAPCDMIAVSSGSTGKPTPWPRSVMDELQVATRFEQIFHDSFAADRKSTLAVICFSLGTWVGGMYTASCCRYLASKGYLITLVTPGNHKEEILRVLQELGSSFEQVVLLGYPPFLKDVIDTGIEQGVNWPHYHIKLVMAGEVFSEEWRDLLGQRVGSESPCYDSAALYGTADAGVLGNETPLSISIRRFLASHPAAARALFGESRLPTLVQYDPCDRFFETHQGTLLFSGNNGIPLVRYHIRDTGGVISYAAMLDFLQGYGYDPIASLLAESAENHMARGIRPFPFVYVFGRSDFTVSYFGANIYPENVTVGLEQPHIRDWVTGKFVMQIKEEADQNRRLWVVVELAPQEQASQERIETLSVAILSELLRLNSEFANYVPSAYQAAIIELVPTGDADYFPVGVKHRYTRR
jgi:phenylacetate-CoA ligase